MKLISRRPEALRAVTIRTLATRDLEIDFETLIGSLGDTRQRIGKPSVELPCANQSSTKRRSAIASPIDHQRAAIESEAMRVSHLRARIPARSAQFIDGRRVSGNPRRSAQHTALGAVQKRTLGRPQRLLFAQGVVFLKACPHSEP